MHLFLVPLIALGALATPVATGEPTEDAMRIAFEARVTHAVAGALDFAAETGGEAARDAIRANGTDRFAMRGFHKTDCEAHDGKGFRCAFRVEIDTIAGLIDQPMSGWFFADGEGFAFADET